MQKCEFSLTEITLLKSRICCRTPFLENTFEDLLLYAVFNIQVVNVEVFHKQVKYEPVKKPGLTLNVTFTRPEVAIVVDKKRKRWGIYTSLLSEFQSLRKT